MNSILIDTFDVTLSNSGNSRSLSDSVLEIFVLNFFYLLLAPTLINDDFLIIQYFHKGTFFLAETFRIF